jgi:hypothetical protein
MGYWIEEVLQDIIKSCVPVGLSYLAFKVDTNQ